MPKKPLSTAQRNIPSTPSAAITDTDNNEPSWDTSPNTFPAYLAKLKRWINKQDERFKPLIEYGYVNVKGTIYCMNDNHIDRIRHRLDAVGTLEEPRQIARADEDPVGLPVLTADQRTADR